MSSAVNLTVHSVLTKQKQEEAPDNGSPDCKSRVMIKSWNQDVSCPYAPCKKPEIPFDLSKRNRRY